MRSIAMGTRMLVGALALAALAGCAVAPPRPPAQLPDALLAGEGYAAPRERIDASDLFTASPAMVAFVQREVLPHARRDGPAHALVDALNDRARLKLEYDSVVTRTAAQAFEARAGNCLSLLVMTASLAREMGLQVNYRSADIEDTFSRSGDLLVASGHVNLQLGRSLMQRDANSVSLETDLIIDFIPGAQAARMRTRQIGEDTVVAMFMNNRAAEALLRGALDDAYAWTRAALQARPDLLQAWNTLGVIHHRHGDLARAEQVFDRVLAQDPAHRHALHNQVAVLAAQGRAAEAEPLRQRLAKLEPDEPYKFFDQGRLAMARGDYAGARTLFAREVARAGYEHEFHFWLGLAHWRLGEMDAAQREFALARDMSARGADRERYAAKLQALRDAAAH